MVDLPNIGGALYSKPQSLADAQYYMSCSNAAKTRNQLKFGGVPQTTGPISAASGPKFTISLAHVEEIVNHNCRFKGVIFIQGPRYTSGGPRYTSGGPRYTPRAHGTSKSPIPRYA